MAITGAGRFIRLAETATNVVRLVSRCATTDGGKWVVSAAVQPGEDTEILHDLVILHGDLASWTTARLYGCTDVQTKLGARA